MTNDRWQRIEELFHRAVDLGPATRAALLDAQCGGDPGLRAEIERLLLGDATGDDPFSRLEAHTRAAVEDPLLGTTLGAYRLTARLATGGMGVIYRGERADGLFQQEVAIKLIRAERSTGWMLRRFEFERRTLAALQHPCIARLYDGGTTDRGWPYFVMELVRGETIDRYCERERLPIAARLRLFVQVCRAVQYAHQSLVVHCDLKPANILIDDRGVPRLLDFGIARLLEGGPSEAVPTAPRLLTMDYASPEQLAGGTITTALDVYSLGVILYELATARRPFPSGEHGAVGEQTTARPSSRMRMAAGSRQPAEIAEQFCTTPAGLHRALRGDLDCILLTALHQEPERRYASVQEFAEDLERHLAGQPVRARPNSLAYRASKFVRRNRLAVLAGTAVLAALLCGLLAAHRSEKIAQAEAQHANMEADSFQGIANFLMDAFLPTQPDQDAAWQGRARAQILAHAERVHRQYANTDHVRANLLDILGQVCQRLDLLADAESLMREAMAIREQAFGPRSLEYSLSLRSLGQLKYQSGDFAEAAGLLAEALPLHRASPTNTHANVAALANDLAACLRNLGRDAEAEDLHQQALALRREKDDGSLPVAESLNNLAGVHLGRGDYAPAIAGLREALTIRTAILGRGHLLTLQTSSNLAGALWRHGQQAAARELMQEAQAGYRALGGDGEDGLGLVLANLAAMQLEASDLDGAAVSLDAALALQHRRLGHDHPLVAVTLSRLAVLHRRRHHDDLARPLWEEVLRIRRAAQSPPRELAEALYGYGLCLADLGAHAAAMPPLEEVIGLHRKQDLGDPAGLGRAEFVLGRCLSRLDRNEAARDHLRAAARALDASPAATADERARVHQVLVEADLRAGK